MLSLPLSASSNINEEVETIHVVLEYQSKQQAYSKTIKNTIHRVLWAVDISIQNYEYLRIHSSENLIILYKQLIFYN